MTMTANERLGLAPTDPRPEDETTPAADRTLTNPLFNDQKMKLGLFGTNCSNGLIMSHVDTTYEATWEHTLAVAQRAEAIGLEALVPVARGKGFGGSTNFNGNCFETYAWAAGLAQGGQQGRRGRGCGAVATAGPPSGRGGARPPRAQAQH